MPHVTRTAPTLGNSCRQREPDLKGRRQLAALQEIEADWENVRAAWQWAVQRRDYSTIDRALESFYWFCIMRSRLQAGQELLRLAQEELAPAQVPMRIPCGAG